MNVFTVLGQNEPSVNGSDKARGRTIGQQLPGRGYRFYLHHTVQTVSSAQSGAHSKDNGLFPWGKSGRGVKFTNHVHLGMELDMQPCTCLHGVRKNFTLNYLFLGKKLKFSRHLKLMMHLFLIVLDTYETLKYPKGT